MSEVKTGLWQCQIDGSYIKVRRIGPDAISYSKECCMDVCYMPKSELLSCYQLYEADDPIIRPYDIEWDMGTQDKTKAILVTVCSKCGSTMPADSVEQSVLSRWAARFKGIEASDKQFYIQIAYSVACIVVGCFIFYMQFFADK